LKQTALDRRKNRNKLSKLWQNYDALVSFTLKIYDTNQNSKIDNSGFLTYQECVINLASAKTLIGDRIDS
jgi:hypothetical protein